jgi:hypothetical protein
MKLMSDSLSKIAPAIVKAQSKMGNAVKDSKNPFFKSSYADLNAVREAVLPAFNENGISVLQPTVYVEGRKFVQTILIHESGEYFSGLTEVLSVKEADAQAQGSGISYARRYGLQSLANVGAEDDDGNGASGKTNIRTTASTSAPKEASGDLDKKEEHQKPASEKPVTGGSKSFRKPKPAAQEEL